jgi:hypothetical protein
MEAIDAIGVWEEVCHPVMVATSKVPDIPYILQLRSARPDLDIFEFKEEVGKILHFGTFLYGLKETVSPRARFAAPCSSSTNTWGPRLPPTSSETTSCSGS